MSSAVHFFTQLWSIYDFKDSELDQFAHEKLIAENRQGLKVMSTVLILLILIAMLLFQQLGQIHNSQNLNYYLVLALAIHINISARLINDIKTLHTLGVVLLVISATAYVFMAHKEGYFEPLLIANIVMLFMIIPLIPWGLREATAVVIAIYFLLTLSSLNVNNQIDIESFRVLQFFLLAAGSTSLLLVIRLSLIRKKELVTHFKLHKAHAELFTLSNTDPLTGAWNRRFTETAVENLIRDFKRLHTHFHFIIFDLDNFKTLNDLFGHDLGDRVLILTSQSIIKRLGDAGYLIRIGGDEFIIVMVGLDPERLMQDITLQINSQVIELNNAAVFGLSWGYVSVPLQPVKNLEAIYQQADKFLYQQKKLHHQRDWQHSQG